MDEIILELDGANMDIDFLPKTKLGWKQAQCPWNKADGTNSHKCAVKNTSICKYFRGIIKEDVVLCAYKK
ncbi:hypothetical protein C4573_07340 [Candidatus Woesearchaeota archaeon]|nr:MAG: hypothetical protein C4573_07340 [Candidatus Woesearchaeota archaeon]